MARIPPRTIGGVHAVPGRLQHWMCSGVFDCTATTPIVMPLPGRHHDETRRRLFEGEHSRAGAQRAGTCSPAHEIEGFTSREGFSVTYWY